MICFNKISSFPAGSGPLSANPRLIPSSFICSSSRKTTSIAFKSETPSKMSKTHPHFNFCSFHQNSRLSKVQPNAILRYNSKKQIQSPLFPSQSSIVKSRASAIEFSDLIARKFSTVLEQSSPSLLHRGALREASALFARILSDRRLLSPASIRRYGNGGYPPVENQQPPPGYYSPVQGYQAAPLPEQSLSTRFMNHPATMLIVFSIAFILLVFGALYLDILVRRRIMSADLLNSNAVGRNAYAAMMCAVDLLRDGTTRHSVVKYLGEFSDPSSIRCFNPNLVVNISHVNYLFPILIKAILDKDGLDATLQ